MEKIHYYKHDLPNGFALQGDLAIDTEAMGLLNMRDRLCVVQFSNGNGEAHLVHFPESNYAAPNLKKLLSDSSRTCIFHFARFDVAILTHYLGITFKNVYCTKIASRLTRTYTDQHGLKDLCLELLDITLSKKQRSSYWGNQELSQDQMQYASNDVLHLHALKEKLDSMLAREGRTDLAKECFKFLPTRALLDLKGWNEQDIFTH